MNMNVRGAARPCSLNLGTRHVRGHFKCPTALTPDTDLIGGWVGGLGRGADGNSNERSGINRSLLNKVTLSKCKQAYNHSNFQPTSLCVTLLSIISYINARKTFIFQTAREYIKIWFIIPVSCTLPTDLRIFDIIHVSGFEFTSVSATKFWCFLYLSSVFYSFLCLSLSFIRHFCLQFQQRAVGMLLLLHDNSYCSAT